MDEYNQLGQSLDKLSLLSDSETVTEALNFQQMNKKIKLAKYPTISIKPVKQISHLISRISAQNLKKQASQVIQKQNKFNFIRQIRGDGNCFIRAVAFEYITHLNSCKIQDCFPYLDQFKLNVSSIQSIPKKFLNYYDHDFLCYCLKQNWQQQFQKQLNKFGNDYRLAYISLLAENPYLDFIIVLYMRALCVFALNKFKQDSQIQNFLVVNDQQKLKDYGTLSDGLTHYLLSRFLNIFMKIYQLRENQIINYSYETKTKQSTIQIDLILHHKHYDILQKAADINAQSKFVKIQLQKRQSYYSNEADQLIQGFCINCRKQFPILKSTNSCQKCLLQYKLKLNQFKKNVGHRSEIQNKSDSIIQKAQLQEIELNKQIVRQKMKKKTQKQAPQQKLQRKMKKNRFFGCFC